MKGFQAACSTALVALAACAATSAARAEVPVSAAFRVGTLGLGAEAAVGLNSYLDLRVPFNLFDYNGNRTEDGIRYDGKLQLRSFGAQLDVHPFAGVFFLSGGVYANGNQLKLHASDPTGNTVYDIGDASYKSDPNDPLFLDGKVGTHSVAPYLGLGWGNAPMSSSRFCFRFEMGAYFEGAGKITLNASGSAMNVQTGQSFDVNGNSPEAVAFQQNLEKERQANEDDISNYRVYPAVGITLGYRFGL